MSPRLRLALTTVALLSCAACGGTDVMRSGSPPSSAPLSSSAPLPPAGGELVTSQSVLPAEAAYGFADIAVDDADAGRAWERFRLEGAPPEVGAGTVLLFRGLGESGSCPFAFSRLEVEADEVRTLGPPPDPADGPATERFCTSDYRARTVVIAVPTSALPAGAFRFDGFVLSATPLDEAPQGPSVVDPWVARDPGLEVGTEPSTAAVGAQVEVRLTTAGERAVPGSWTTLLDYWDGRRWLPAAGSDRHLDHPAATPGRTAVPAGSTGRLAVVDTADLPPGQYRVSARVGLGDADGSTGVQGFFTVTG